MHGRYIKLHQAMQGRGGELPPKVPGGSGAAAERGEGLAKLTMKKNAMNPVLEDELANAVAMLVWCVSQGPLYCLRSRKILCGASLGGG